MGLYQTPPAAPNHAICAGKGRHLASRACAPSRFDDPELAEFLPPRAPDPFDSENAPELIGSVFDIVRTDS
jgi:hypothetical protein